MYQFLTRISGIYVCVVVSTPVSLKPLQRITGQGQKALQTVFLSWRHGVVFFLTRMPTFDTVELGAHGGRGTGEG